MGYGNEQTLHRRRCTSNQHIYECSTSRVIREMQIKTTYDSISPQLEWWLSSTQATIGVGEDVGKKVHSYIAGGVGNYCSHSGKQYGHFSESLEWNHHLTQLSYSLSIPKGLKISILQRYSHINVHNCSIHHSQIVEPT